MDASEEVKPSVMQKEETESPVETVPEQSGSPLHSCENDPIVEEQSTCDGSLVHNETEQTEQSAGNDLKEDSKTGEEITELASGSGENHMEATTSSLNEATKTQKRGELQDPTIVPRDTRYFAHDLRGDAAQTLVQSRVTPKRKSDGEWRHDRFDQEPQSSRHNRPNRRKANSKTHQPNERDASGEKCYLCQQFGHIARDCPNSDVGVVKSEVVPEEKPKPRLPKGDKPESSPTVKKPLGHSQKPVKWTRKRREPEKSGEPTVRETGTSTPVPRMPSGIPEESPRPFVKPLKQIKKPQDMPVENTEVFNPQRRQATMDLTEGSRSNRALLPVTSPHPNPHRRELPAPKSNPRFTRNSGMKEAAYWNKSEPSRNQHDRAGRTSEPRARFSEHVREGKKSVGSWGARQHHMDLKPGAERKSSHPLSTPAYQPRKLNTQPNLADEKNASRTGMTSVGRYGVQSSGQEVSDMPSAPNMPSTPIMSSTPNLQPAPNTQSTPNMQPAPDMRLVPNMQSAPQGMWPNPNAPELYEGEENRMMYMMPQQPIMFYHPYFMMDQNMPEMMFPMMGYPRPWGH